MFENTPVVSEPVCGANSLLTGKIARKLANRFGLRKFRLYGADFYESHGTPHFAPSAARIRARRSRLRQVYEGNARCKGSRAWDPRKDFSQCMQQPTTHSTSNVISPQQERTEPSGHRPCRRGAKSSPRREPDTMRGASPKGRRSGLPNAALRNDCPWFKYFPRVGDAKQPNKRQPTNSFDFAPASRNCIDR